MIILGRRMNIDSEMWLHPSWVPVPNAEERQCTIWVPGYTGSTQIGTQYFLGSSVWDYFL